MSYENYEKVLEKCKYYIKEFEPCGLRGDVERRILELVQEWEKRKADGERKGKLIGGLETICMDLLRAVKKAEADSKNFGKNKCEYFRKWLSLPFTEKGGLGYWASQMWQ
jgi:hypothetical protein